MASRTCFFMALLATAGLAHGEGWQTVLEAERAGAIIAPAHTIPSPRAREGSCVMLSEANANVRSALRNLDPNDRTRSGEVDFEVDIPAAGRYVVWARVQWHCVCADSFYLLTSGTPETVPASAEVTVDPMEPFHVRANLPPRTWRWIRATTCRFEAGKQTIRLIQAGHEALLDAIMVTGAEGAVPPGYDDQSRECAFSLSERAGATQVGWRPTGNNTCEIPLGESEWADFQLDLVVPSAPVSPWEVRFAQQPDGSAYRVRLKDGTAFLNAVQNGTGRVLSQRDCPVSADHPHRLRLVRLGETIAVSLDGAEILRTEDTTLAAGPVSLYAEGGKGFSFRALELRPLVNHVEHFQAGIGDWVVEGGEWRTVDGAGTGGGAACLGRSRDDAAQLTPAWGVGGEHILATHIQLPEAGGAGLAFDVLDSRNRRELLIERDEAGHAAVRIHAVTDGQRKLLSSWDTAADPGQWHSLRLTRRSDYVEAELDDVSLGKIRLANAGETAGVGLALTPRSTSLFGSVRVRSCAQPWDDEFLVEGAAADVTLSQWRPVEGTVRVQGHPSAIFMNPARAGEPATLALDRAVAGDAQLEVTYYKYRPGANKPKHALHEFPDVVLPPLPGAARTGPVFRRKENGVTVEYSLLTDLETMREVVLRRNEEVLARAYSPKPDHPQGFKAFLRFDGTTLTGGVPGVAEVHATIPEGGPEPMNVAVTARNLTELDEAGIVEMRLSR